MPLTSAFGGMFAGDRDSPCFQCGSVVEQNALFVEEWDCIIHRECLPAFLNTEEGGIVMLHGHEILVPELS